MRFLSLEVEDMFAYSGLSRVDLSACSSERNIVIVSGRNGAGKTSLLNAIKLLFLGSQDEGLRRVSFGKSEIGAKHFVLGQPGRWYGVFNTRAGHEDARARVALEWEDAGATYKVERSFRRVSESVYDESLVATIDGRAVREPELFLLQLLPREVVPFFFFDGEQIQSIADAEVGREQTEIERLLGLSYVAALIRQVEIYAKKKYRAGLPDEARVLVVQSENAKREAQAREELASNARVAFEIEVQELAAQRSRLDKERSRLRTGIAESERRRLLGRIDVLETQYVQLAMEAAEQLPKEAPWLTNLPLTQQAFRMLEEEVSRNANPHVAVRLHQEMPPELVKRLSKQEPPVQLNERQRQQFRKDVSAVLESMGIAAEVSTSPLLNSLSPRQMQALHRRFVVWADKGASLAGAHASLLQDIRRVHREKMQIRRELHEAEITSDEARERFDDLTTQIQALEQQEHELRAKMTEHQLAEQQARRDVAAANEKIARAEREFELVSQQNKGYQLGRQVKAVLEEYRHRRRMQIRQSVENRLNDHVALLLATSQLIKSVRLDDNFHMTYYDTHGEHVARRSVSAGMRQLLAMSMLWALKDEARRPLPVVIDTPLGRIDRQNRSLLMREYFPHAGNPLLLLPTDSEIASDEYAMLSRHVARRYEIRNTDGQDARIVEVD